MKSISWNCVSINLPKDWEITFEGGTRFNGFMTYAPPEGCKLEIYWRSSKGSGRQHESYVKRFLKKGFHSRSKGSLKIREHEANMAVLEKEGYKVIVSSWFCDQSRRFFIAQLDGEKASSSLFSKIISSINCHLCSETIVPWNIMGLGLKLYSDYFVTTREFRIGYSMGFFLSNDKKVSVTQYAIARYVIDSQRDVIEEARARALRSLIPRFTKLQLVENNGVTVYAISNVLTNRLIYGYLVTRGIECLDPPYLQFTFIKVSKRERLVEAKEIAENTYCTEW